MLQMTTIKIADDLAQELDRIAGAGKRSAYAADVLWRDVRRIKQRQSLRASAGAWKPEDHPELSHGGASYVEQIRSERDERFEASLESERR
jgi:hypothetical protein